MEDNLIVAIEVSRGMILAFVWGSQYSQMLPIKRQAAKYFRKTCRLKSKISRPVESQVFFFFLEKNKESQVIIYS